jgi:hypothetical protein
MVRGNRRKILNGIFLKVGLFLGRFANERANPAKQGERKGVNFFP